LQHAEQVSRTIWFRHLTFGGAAQCDSAFEVARMEVRDGRVYLPRSSELLACPDDTLIHASLF
jgi:hypothetical protein